MTRATLAVAADYADAMLIARRWKNLLFLVLLLCLFIQIGVFLFVRFYGGGSVILTAGSTTQPAVTSTQDVMAGLQWLVGCSGFLAMVAVVVLAIVMLLIVGIMLVGRLIGVSHVTGAFVWCVLLAALLFPWQSLWNYPMAGTLQSDALPTEDIRVGPRFGIPGALYTWPELQHRGHFSNDPLPAAIMGWGRFAGWPGFAVLILLSVQIRSSRGLKFALGEAEIQIPETVVTTPTGSL
jgi:hypothetical protein